MSNAGVRTGRPFSDAHVLQDLGEGRFRADLDDVWAIGPKAFGGLLMVLMTDAALARLAAGGAPGLDPLAVSADFLRAPDLAPVDIEAEPLKLGRTISSVVVRLSQGGRLMLHATVTAGVLADPAADGAVRWQGAPSPLEPAPPADAIDPADAPGGPQGIAAACEMRYRRGSLPFLTGDTGAPEMAGWVRPRGEEPDLLFALMAGDILPPTVFNLGGSTGWAPTVQLTALLRARPAPGWLRVSSHASAVVGTQFDEDVTVVDSAGRVVCQARQLALAPLQG
ncbi:thioesterase family protein [Pseudonocardia phyllosphaerae]|uniref:thioesterase family protein n=1 Tax=Pseudonocardia phyllosphaerae TaxID=3390502 RepID=UPI00397C4AB6